MLLSSKPLRRLASTALCVALVALSLAGRARADVVDDVFGKRGVLSKHFAGYAPRQGQIEYAKAVEAAISSGEPLLAEGPTGTGKSFGYAVPAIYHAATQGKKVIIVTGNIALQEQLVGKDLPFLQKALPWKFSYELLKGRSNYVCDAKLLLRKQQTPSERSKGLDADQRKQAGQVQRWAGKSKTGDVSELPFKPSHDVWKRFSVSSEQCAGVACPLYGACKPDLQRDRVKAANVVVTNYHMFFSRLKRAGEEGPFGKDTIVIFDEAHKAADIAREVMGEDLRMAEIRFIAFKLRELGHAPLAATLEGKAKQFFSALALHLREARQGQRIGVNNPVAWQALGKALDDAAAKLLEIGAQHVDGKTIQRVAGEAIRASKHLKRAMGAGKDKDWVHYLEVPERGQAPSVLASRPLDVSGMLQRKLFNGKHRPIVTSATLSVNGSFEHVARELGIKSYRGVNVRSPFDYKSNSLVIVPKDIPLPNEPGYQEAVAKVFKQVVEMAGGRTLGLFTSYRNMDAAHQAVLGSKKVQGAKLALLRQGDKPRTQLVEQFRKDETSVLVGTESFWAGVDVPGKSLSVVVIDRLPFPHAHDPMAQGFGVKDPSGWFSKYSLPRAGIALKQGHGRLIRSQQDRGVVVILDRRLTEKKYGQTHLLPTLPDAPMSHDLADVGRFLAKKPSARKRARTRTRTPTRTRTRSTKR
ncbi:MAG: ATP-dependent DNA helicase [Myxococcales bacterium]|nr:ATP-dependent DNA helicase [Myxococcales bacterium]